MMRLIYSIPSRVLLIALTACAADDNNTGNPEAPPVSSNSENNSDEAEAQSSDIGDEEALVDGNEKALREKRCCVIKNSNDDLIDCDTYNSVTKAGAVIACSHLMVLRLGAGWAVRDGGGCGRFAACSGL